MTINATDAVVTLDASTGLWCAMLPGIPGAHAAGLTREDALRELGGVLSLLAEVESSEADAEQARLITALFDRWALELPQRRDLLAWPAAPPEGWSALPFDGTTRARAQLLLRIHALLRLLFPENPSLRYSWVHRANAAFGGEAPLAMMLRDGLPGIRRVFAVLEHQAHE